MGVPGLWPLLTTAVEPTSLLAWSEDAFQSSARRGAVVGVDASLWLFHIKKMGDIEDAGPNADIRILFYRLCTLLQRGLLPLFVFDGPSRPAFKRGKYVGGHGGRGTEQQRAFVEMIAMFGMEWRKAPGEAEAELAAMEMRGELDAIMTDDVDTLVFGARVIIRNSSATLSGNISEASRSAPPSSESDAAGPSSSQPSRTASKADVSIYRSSRIASDVQVDRSGLILVALMSGGDYDQTGLVRCGVVISMALAKAGYGGYLVDRLKKHERSRADLEEFLEGWREDVAHELETNDSGWMKRKEKALAATVRAAKEFPNLSIVRDYTNPKVSVGAPLPQWDGVVDVQAIVGFVSRTFEWPVQDIVCKLRNNLWKGLAMREFRQKALEMDRNLPRQVANGSSRAGSSSEAAPLDFPSLSPASKLSKSLDLFQLASPTKSRRTPSTLLVAGVHDYKKSSATEGVFAYRVELNTSPFLADITPHLPFPDPFEITDSPSEDETASPPASPTKKRRKPVKEAPGRAALSHWISAEFLKFAEGASELIEEYEAKISERDRKKEAAAKRKRAKEAGESPTKAKAPPKARSKAKRPPDAGAPPSLSQPNPSRRLDDDDVFKVPAIVRKNSAPSSKTQPLARASSLQDLDSDSDSDLPPSSVFGNSHLHKSPRKNVAQASPSKSKIKPKPIFINIDDDEEEDGVPMLVAKEAGVAKKAGTVAGNGGGRKKGDSKGRWSEVDVVDLCSSD